jgi:hypothetical protein
MKMSSPKIKIIAFRGRDLIRSEIILDNKTVE